MAATRLSIRIDLASGDRIGPGKIALLEAIRTTGSISGAARALGMSYRRAWLLIEGVNDALREPAVTAEIGGHRGGGAALTSVGERVVDLYRSDRIASTVGCEWRIPRHRKAGSPGKSPGLKSPAAAPVQARRDHQTATAPRGNDRRSEEGQRRRIDIAGTVVTASITNEALDRRSAVMKASDFAARVHHTA